MSLRARLLVGLTVLVAIGLAVVGAVTYTQQRSFLLSRVDQQALATGSLGAASRALDAAGINVVSSGSVRPRPGRPAGGPGPGPPADGGRGAFGPGLGPGGVSDFLPLGTFAARRDASGRVVGHTTLGQTALPAPKLPAQIPLSRPPRSAYLITVGSVGGSGLRYRVMAVPTGDQPGSTVVAIPLREVDQSLNSLLRNELLVGGIALLSLAALAWWMINLGLRPLDRIGGTAGAIAAGDLSRRVSPASERTEVGRLGLALNAMLGQIEAAFAERQASEQRLRRFLADASHELRTPLASIRGYAELFRIGAARRPDEVEKAMRRIEDESVRMGVLVEDMLTLARLDQLPRGQRAPVDLGRLAADAADDARATAPERSISVELQEPVEVLGDVHQLRQVLGNLVRNALVHTPAGTPIEVRASRDGNDVLLEVRDHGRGLPAGAPDAIFERFWRAERGRERGRGGAGLGLAIVAAIVTAHGGSASAANAPGGGASFVVRLPGSPVPVGAQTAPVPTIG